ncbi:GNAT family N-acetyltransferase [Kingella negevensis]|uniref:Acetyltransferase Pat n=1 Tax=Kingella negevensis TaxID=1522312 RepID=A0A238TBX2_9NEIS|nr:bifunctional acetate--CoA ligase family protein/GNAT family N-acetyltransferase [Kingella negevensis]MDK4680885.1 GNAT family N-acetyltransferase [Kingella negevensis]MDK4681392.1 GNAT family N-acetyltransferase [Kingella negevensis]MDK4684028.1 GNAT family N-acetyltransferase [Kingella negevensis]MDK4691779.1 GNAT family N-acetyltransferase [Kingella negevensis]MDK4693068.1 GNAT family N-acetyltransferase [Kingella negevensis]
MNPLHTLFHPQSIAVIGASERYGSAGRNVFSLLTANQCAATITPINPNHKTIGGQKSYSSLSEATNEHTFDVIVIVLAADKVSSIIREANKANIQNIVLINELDPTPSSLKSKLDRAAEQARKANIQLIAVPISGLLGLFKQPENTACAYIGQSSGIADCMDNYTQERGIVFSRFLTLNPHSYPVSTGKIIDYIAAEPTTTALLVHISKLDNPRELISALAAASRHKPIVLLSTLADREEEALFAQALERVHVLTVSTLTQFFTASKLIHTGIISRGKNLSIISNSPQISTLLLKTVASTELNLAEPSAATTRAISKMLAYKPSEYNPLDLPADTVSGVFQAAVSQYLSDENTDAVAFIYAGTNAAESNQVAQMVSSLQKQNRKPLLLVWLGRADTEDTRKLFNSRKNLHFKQPEHALHALVQLNWYRQHSQQRHRTGAFHDYHYAHTATEELRKHLRPLLPIAVLPAGKTNSAYFLTGLQAYYQPDFSKKNNHLQLNWEKQEPFGQVLTLRVRNRQVKLLPPVTPEIISKAISQLNLPNIIWQDWLLNCADILSRLPEIHSSALELSHDADKGIVCSNIALNLQDVESFTGSPNIFTPYPTHEQQITLKSGETAWLRPVRPEDASLIQRLAAEQSEQSRYTRFMSKANNIPPALLARLSHPDYQREYALLLHDEEQNPLAHASYTADPDMQSCEFGISIADKLQGQGVGVLLMHKLIERAKEQGFVRIRAEILADNHPMQKLALKLGFVLSKNAEDNGLVDAVLTL